MLKIGITGGIGSGKTTICKVFELLGVPVFYADDEAKEIMVKDGLLMAQIKQHFGENSYLEGSVLNRKHIADIVFKDKSQLEMLNSFVHPAVFKAMDIWVSKQKSSYVLKEAALLFESGSYLQNDFNILVISPLKLRVERVMARDNTNEDKVMERVKAQMPQDEQEKMADFIINNNEENFIIQQVLHLHQKFLKRAQQNN